MAQPKLAKQVPAAENQITNIIRLTPAPKLEEGMGTTNIFTRLATIYPDTPDIIKHIRTATTDGEFDQAYYTLVKRIEFVANEGHTLLRSKPK